MSTDVGVISVTDVGPRLVSHSGRSFMIASYRLSELALSSCSCDNVAPDPERGLDAPLLAQPPSVTASTRASAAKPRFRRLMELESGLGLAAEAECDCPPAAGVVTPPTRLDW